MIVLDLETIQDPRFARREDNRPRPMHQNIVCMGVAYLRDWKVEKARAVMGDEAEILAVASRFPRHEQLVTWNGRGFDLPVLVARCFAHGVPFPWIAGRDATTRYKTSSHLDVMDALALNGAGSFTSLGDAAVALGLEKLESGSQVQDMWDRGERERIARYCLQDVKIAAAAALRLALVNGSVSREQHDEAFAGIVNSPQFELTGDAP